jgi:hypothetical protein
VSTQPLAWPRLAKSSKFLIVTRLPLSVKSPQRAERQPVARQHARMPVKRQRSMRAMTGARAPNNSPQPPVHLRRWLESCPLTRAAADASLGDAEQLQGRAEIVGFS